MSWGSMGAKYGDAETPNLGTSMGLNGIGVNGSQNWGGLGEETPNLGGNGGIL